PFSSTGLHSALTMSSLLTQPFYLLATCPALSSTNAVCLPCPGLASLYP
uniref:Uncharacterized protein n=1 Tax=Aegilops tauschii subsp. strangulata TaxID=200361 RepID=A0A453LDH2_AEGTS